MKEIKRLSDNAYDEIFALSQFAFQYELSVAELAKKKAEADRHVIYGWMVNDEIAAKLHVIPLKTYINGQVIEMGGISSVATWPEYRRQGIIKHLLYHALTQMKKSGQIVSFLHPFSASFYRKYGWELAFTQKMYEIPIEKLQRDWQAKGYVRRIKKDIPLLHRIYTAYSKRYTGMLVRDEKWWEQRVLTDTSQQIAVAYNEQDQALGYAIYNVKENVCKVKEMAYTSITGWRLLLQFIANHDSMAKQVKLVVPENDHLNLLLDEPIYDQKVSPYFMARIVDVFSFLKQYQFHVSEGMKPFMLSVVDSFFPENDGVYQFAYDGAGIDVTRTADVASGQGVQCSVQLLTSMFLGHQRPFELYQLGLLQGEVEGVKQLEQLIPGQQTFLADYF